MSAIFGLMHRDGRPVEPESIQKMNSALAVHGPDGGGLIIRGNMAFGHRLHGFTPEDRYERQPLEVDDGVWLVSAGRIDNRKELLRELGIRSEEAATMPDSEFIRRAWLRWGEQCPARLMGAFTFAVFDRNAETFFIARSPRGEHALHFSLTPRVFAFSSAPAGLFTLPLVKREIDFDRIADLLLFRPYDLDATFFAGIGTLRPGHTMKIGLESERRARFHSLRNLTPIRFRRDEEYVDAFREVFDRAVADTMRSSTPLGLLLSGGLDSTAVGASAATSLAAAGQRLTTFTAVPSPTAVLPSLPNRCQDESPFVKAMGRRYRNLDTCFVVAPDGSFLKGIVPFFAVAETPGLTFNRTWGEESARQARLRGIQTMLSGSAGNLTISWAGTSLMPQLLREGRWGRLWKEARAASRVRGDISVIRSLIWGLRPAIPAPVWLALLRLRHPWDRHRNATGWLDLSPIGKELFFERRAAVCGSGYHSVAGPELRYNSLERCDWASEVYRGYRALYGVDFRDPTDDLRVVEFCLSIPEEQFLRDGTDRWLVRRALSSRVPQEIIDNRRRGIQSADWQHRLISTRAEVLEELDLLERCAPAKYAVDLKGIRRIIMGLPENAAQSGPKNFKLGKKVSIGLIVARFLRWVDSGS